MTDLINFTANLLLLVCAVGVGWNVTGFVQFVVRKLQGRR